MKNPLFITLDFNARLAPKKKLYDKCERRFLKALLLHAATIPRDNCGDFEIMKKKVFFSATFQCRSYWEMWLSNYFIKFLQTIFCFSSSKIVWGKQTHYIELEFSSNVVRARNKCSINPNWFIKASAVCVYTFAIITHLTFLRLQCDSLFSLETASWNFFS